MSFSLVLSLIIACLTTWLAVDLTIIFQNNESLSNYADEARERISDILFYFIAIFTLSFLFRPNLYARIAWISALSMIAVCIVLNFAIVYSGGGLENITDKNDPYEYLYFSMVTFTTLGYGDIQPTGELRIIAATQAVLGFTFVPVIISEIVSLPTRSSGG